MRLIMTKMKKIGITLIVLAVCLDVIFWLLTLYFNEPETALEPEPEIQTAAEPFTSEDLQPALPN